MFLLFSILDIGAVSTAELVDHAKLLNVTKEKQKDEMVAKQTIRIKAPVTSEVLQDHISHLKNINSDNKRHVRIFF